MRVLVTAATGRLGSLVDVLTARGHAVRAMTRDPSSAAAERLRQLGAEVVRGDFEDRDAIAAAAVSMDALFATGTAHKSGPDGELRHGINVAEAAAAAGVPHLVYVSGDGAAADSPLPLFRAKHAVEDHIRSLKIPHTILAPVYFMENLFNPWNIPVLQTGRVPWPIRLDMPLQQIALADLVAFAADAIGRPADTNGQRIALASDEVTGHEAAAAISAAIGRDLAAEETNADKLPPGLRALFRWLETTGHGVDIRALREADPEVGWRRYDGWAREQRTRFASLCRHEDHAPVS
jgi:uncharacterized protein YbjT (DUF2867 family)